MPSLNPKTWREIIELLEPRMHTEGSRKTLVTRAFQSTPRLLGQINFRGTSSDFVTHLVERLIQYGEIERDKQALWALLEVVHEGVGVNVQDQIDNWRSEIEKLSQPPSPPPPPREQPSRPDPVQLLPQVEQMPTPIVDEFADKPPTVYETPGSPPEKEVESTAEPLKVTPPQFPTQEQESEEAEKATRAYLEKMLPVPKQNPNFYIAAHLVSNALFFHFVVENPEWRPARGGKAQSHADSSYLRHWVNGKPTDDAVNLPVTYISFYAAKAFAKWLSGVTGRKIRLPTEKEWQIAVRAGRTNWFEEEMRAKHVNYFRTSNALTPIAAFPANPYGIHDLLGNAYDMCVLADESLTRVLGAGGCYHNSENQLQDSIQIESHTTCRSDTSFRCVYSA